MAKQVKDGLDLLFGLFARRINRLIMRHLQTNFRGMDNGILELTDGALSGD